MDVVRWHIFLIGGWGYRIGLMGAGKWDWGHGGRCLL